MSKNHNRRRSRLASTPERREHIAHRPLTDAERAHRIASYRRDAALARESLGSAWLPQIVKGHLFEYRGVSGTSADKPNRIHEIEDQLAVRGLCKLEPLGEDDRLITRAIYVDERINIAHFAELLRAIRDAEDHTPTEQTPDLGHLTDQMLATEPFADLQAISQEFLGQQE